MGKDFSGQAPASAGRITAPSAEPTVDRNVAPIVTITCSPGISLPADWKVAWLEAGWRVEERATGQIPAFALIAPANDDPGTQPFRAPDQARADASADARTRVAAATVPSRSTASAPGSASLASRSAFLSHLSDVMRQPERGCCALLSMRIDQSATVAQAERSAIFDLEERICERVMGLLDHRDHMTIWLELGFGILVQRDASAPVWDLATRMCARIAAEPFDVDGAPVALTASIGLALAPRGPLLDGGHPWFASAYAAQALAHRHGGNRPEGLLTREFEPMPPERVMIIREWASEAKTGGNVLIEYRAFMPMKPTSPPLYGVQAKLRDLRAPLRGVHRDEYLRLARDAGAMVMIDRMSLFQAFQTLEQEHAHGRPTRLLVPVEAATLGGIPWRWLDAELRRRAHLAERLMIELHAGVYLAKPEATASMAQLRERGVHICLFHESTDLVDVSSVFARLPADFLRVPASVVEALSVPEFTARLSAWRVRERRLIVDGVTDIKAMMVNGLIPDYLAGDAIAVAGPRLEHEFYATP